MKFFLYLLTIVLFFSCTNYQSKDYEEFNLKSKVKSVKSEKFKAIEKFGEIEKSKKEEIDFDDSKDFEISNSLLEFNENGELFSLTNFFSSGKLLQKTITEDTNMKTYDKNGKLLFLIKADDRNNPTEANAYDEDGDLYFKIKFSYNENKELMEEKTFNSEGNLDEAIQFFYENGLVSSKKIIKIDNSYWGDKSETETTENYKYNKNKDYIEQEISSESRTKIHTYEYEYDNKNNWTKRIQFTDGKPSFIVERDITYY